jgi:hypothetical protein
MVNVRNLIIALFPFSLTKEYKDRPTYQELMKTEFFEHFSKLSNKIEIVANYVQKMLEVQKQFPNRTLE